MPILVCVDKKQGGEYLALLQTIKSARRNTPHINLSSAPVLSFNIPFGFLVETLLSLSFWMACFSRSRYQLVLTSPVQAFAAQLLRKDYVYSFHGKKNFERISSVSLWKKKYQHLLVKSSFFFQRNALIHSQKVLVPHHASFTFVQQYYQIDTISHTIIPNGIDESLFFPVSKSMKAKLRQKLGIPKNALLIVSVGNFIPEKGSEELQKLWIRTSTDKSLFFIVFSPEIRKGFPFFENVKNMHVSFRQISRYYQAADIYLSISHSEQSSLALREAIQCGMLPLVTPTGDTQLLRKNLPNLVLTETDPGSILEKIYWLRNLSGLKKQKLQNQIYQVFSRSSWDKSSEKFLNAVCLAYQKPRR